MPWADTMNRQAMISSQAINLNELSWYIAEPLTEIIKRLCNGNGCCQNATADKFVFKLQPAEPLTQRIAHLCNGDSCCQHAAATEHVKMLVYLSIDLSILRFQTPTRRTPDSKNCTVMQWDSCCQHAAATQHVKMLVYLSIDLSIRRFQTPTRRTPDSKNCTVMHWRQLLSTCSSNTACEDASLSIYRSIYPSFSNSNSPNTCLKELHSYALETAAVNMQQQHSMWRC